jgi:hypothetical protein
MHKGGPSGGNKDPRRIHGDRGEYSELYNVQALYAQTSFQITVGKMKLTDLQGWQVIRTPQVRKLSSPMDCFNSMP